MCSGTTHSWNCSAVTYPLLTAACCKDQPCLCAVLAISLALSYPMWGLSAVTNIKDSCNNCAMRVSLATIPSRHFSEKFCAARPNNRADDNTLAAMTGLNTLSSKWPCAPANVTAA